jgi:surface antigen
MVALVAAVLSLTGCATADVSHEDSGMIIGGVLGGVLGSQVGGGHGRTAAIIAGALAGAAIGGSIGRSMDESDRAKTAQTLEGVRTGVASTWRNPDTGIEYTVTPTRTFDSEAGPCREFATEAVIGAKKETVYGTACRQADGSWKVQG